jgi:hypothetical protein
MAFNPSFDTGQIIQVLIALAGFGVFALKQIKAFEGVSSEQKAMSESLKKIGLDQEHLKRSMHDMDVRLAIIETTLVVSRRWPKRKDDKDDG